MSSPGIISTPSGPQFAELASPVDDKVENDSHSTTPIPRSAVSRETRVNLHLRLFLFCLIEAGFIALAAVCLVKPLPLHIALRFSDSEVKGGFTVVFIVWHTLAILAGGHILADAFSREWSVQLANIVPGTTDRVSTVTSGMLDRILHIITKHASGTFKLAFLASLTFMALTQLAPGTISAATTTISVPIIANIARQISQIDNGNIQQFLTASTRANLIVRLEKTELTPFGFKLPPNALVSLPPHVGEFNGSLEYNTDIVEFHHDCHWEAPTVINGSNPVVQVAGQTWQTSLIVGGQANAGSSIFPLSLSDLPTMLNVGTTAYLFIGGNSTFRNSRTTPTSSFAINLGNLPATFVTQGVGVFEGADIRLVGPLASVLVCDPHLSVSGGRVHVTNNGIVSIVSSGQTPDGSFPISAANLILSNAFQIVLTDLEALELTNLVNNAASIMFISNNSINWETAQNMAPLDIPTINKNVDDFMSSAAKAFVDGYRKIGPSAGPTFDLTTIPGIGEEQRLALITSKGLFITTIVVDCIAIALLYALCRSALTQKRYPFDLTSVFHVLSEDPNRRASLLSPTLAREQV